VHAPYYYNDAAPHISQQDAALQQPPPGPGMTSWFEFSNSGYVKGFPDYNGFRGGIPFDNFGCQLKAGHFPLFGNPPVTYRADISFF